MLSLLCTRDNFGERMFYKAAFLTLGVTRGVGKTSIASNCGSFFKKGDILPIYPNWLPLVKIIFFLRKSDLLECYFP